MNALRDLALTFVWRVVWLVRRVRSWRVRRRIRTLSERLARGERGIPRMPRMCSACAIQRARYVARDAVPYFPHLCESCLDECTTLERNHYAEYHT